MSLPRRNRVGRPNAVGRRRGGRQPDILNLLRSHSRIAGPEPAAFLMQASARKRYRGLPETVFAGADCPARTMEATKNRRRSSASRTNPLGAGRRRPGSMHRAASGSSPDEIIVSRFPSGGNAAASGGSAARHASSPRLGSAPQARWSSASGR